MTALDHRPIAQAPEFVKPAPVMALWRVADLITKLVTSDPDLIADLQDSVKRLREAQDNGAPSDVTAALKELHDVQAALIVGRGEVRQLAAAGGAR